MSRHRIYDLAKEFQVENKIILDILKKNDIPVKSASSTIDDVQKEVLAKALKQVNTTSKPQPVKSESAKSQPAANTQVESKGSNKGENGGKEQLKNTKNKETQPKNQNKADDNGQAKQANAQRPNNNQKSNNSNQKNGNHKSNNGGNQQNAKSNDHSHNQKNGGQKSNNQKNNGNNQNHSEKNERNERNERNNERNERSERNERNNRSERGERGERGDRERRNGKNSERNRNNNNNNGFGNNRNNRNNKKNKNQPAPQKMEVVRPKSIKVGENIIVKELASKLMCTAAEIVKKLFLSFGQMATINDSIDFDTATLVASEYGVEVEELPPEVDLTEIPEIEDDPKMMTARPPVVTVMGHVDHGKTSLLDNIRKTSVTSQEAGGITQHIGAYQVKCQGKKIVFLDTPGHEAFTEMRARGAQVTDIAILVVAADDGVMPQTVEAIHHAKSADVPIIVAINKIDKPGADPTRVKNELMEHGLVAEEYGGDTIMVEVSAKKQINISGLLEMILLVAEMQELKANAKCDARGIIIEAKLDKGRGSVATVLVQKGTLHIGDSIVAGTCFGKVRAMINDRGENVKKAGPSVPVEVLGLNEVPSAGDELAVLDEKLARTIAAKRVEKQHMDMIHAKKVSLDDLFQRIQDGSIKDLNVLVKADVQGSVEALNSSLLALNKNDEVRVSIVHSGVGAVNESDVMLASAANALIIAFNVRPDANARNKAEDEGIDIRTYRVIYDALNDVKAAMSGMLAPKFKEVIQGQVEIRQVMVFNKTLKVAGSYVLEGKITNKSKIRIIRDNIEVFDGELEDLRRFKDAVKEVAAGYECGITIQDYRDFQEGDIIEAYTMVEVETNINDVNKKSDK